MITNEDRVTLHEALRNYEQGAKLKAKDNSPAPIKGYWQGELAKLAGIRNRLDAMNIK